MRIHMVWLLVICSTLTHGQMKLIANDDSKEIDEGKSANINVLANDFGFQAETIQIIIEETPEVGITVLEEDNTITYQPELNFAGFVKIKYKISNGKSSSNVATVELRIRSVNYMPQPVNDTVIVYANERKYLDILHNDIDIYDAPIAISIVEDLKHGRAHIDSQNNVFAEFDEFFYGSDTCKYEIVDVDNDRGYAQIFYEVKPGESGFFIPEAFSPNGDNINDTFFIPELQIMSKVKIQFYDAHGMLVYMDNDYQNDWGGLSNIGRLRGEKCVPGVYYYFIDVPDVKERLSGFVYLSY